MINAMLVCMPVAALICMITIIGVPLGLLCLLLYFLLLLVGYVSTGIWTDPDFTDTSCV